MLRRPTVVVIGAGAGVDIDMPLGSALSTTIAAKLNIRFDLYEQRSGDHNVTAALRRIAKERGEDFNVWRTAACSVAGGIQYTRSIDAYLNTHQENERLKIAGKLAIVQSILEAENRSSVYINKGSNEWQQAEKTFGSWLPKLFYVIQDGIIQSDNLENLFSNLCVINFNYDRCLEQFLLKVVSDLYGKNEQVAIDLVKRLKIFHPYGSVGSLWPGARQVGFGVTDYGDIAGLSGEINTFNEKLEERGDLNEMRLKISEAEQIVFLGFHFHSQNMALLHSVAPARGSGVHVYATATHRSDADSRIIDNDIRAMLGPRGGSWTIFVERMLDCNKLLQDYTSTLLR
jgi:hypothetical protein